MKIMKNKKGVALQTVGIVITIFAILVTVVLATQDKGITIPGGDKKQVECDVSITDPLFGNPNIKQVSCSVVDTCLFAIAPLSFFKEQGNVKLIVNNNVVDDKNFDIFQVVGDQTLTLRTCTTADGGIIRLVDENNDLIDSQEVTF